jgi:hypothetical protein
VTLRFPNAVPLFEIPSGSETGPSLFACLAFYPKRSLRLRLGITVPAGQQQAVRRPELAIRLCNQGRIVTEPVAFLDCSRHRDRWFESGFLQRGAPANLRVFAGSGARNRRRGAAETFSLALRLGRAITSADHGLRVRRHGGDVAAVWREKQTEAGSDDRIALEGTGEMIEILAE